MTAKNASKNWQRRWDRCQASEGDYFEGDVDP